MEKLKVCFVGVGSIAKRHIKNLREICADDGTQLIVDAFRHSVSGNNGIPDINNVYYNINDVPDDYDAIFITNPTEYHLSALKEFSSKGKHFFIEKPVVSVQFIEEAKSFAQKSDAVYYVAAPLRYNAVIQYIKNNINTDDVISVRSISSSYLPDWRPGQDYRDTYSAHKALGGGVGIDLIHEWDYLTYIFDKPYKLCHLSGKRSPLEIDSDDYAVYIADNGKQIFELHLDYFGRSTIREIQLFIKSDTVIGDIANNKVSFLKQGTTVEFDQVRDDFQKRELRYFLDMISGIKPAESNYHHALDVLQLTQGTI